MMKKITYLFIFIFFSTLSVSAQFRKGGKERIKALKIAYITDQLDLTSEEAEKFWPVYNQYDKSINFLNSSGKFGLKRRVMKSGGINALSDKEAKKIALKLFSIEKEIYETTSKFHSKLKGILSYKKILKLKVAEREFHRKLIGRLQNRKRPQR